jgi:hypothetical protein
VSSKPGQSASAYLTPEQMATANNSYKTLNMAAELRRNAQLRAVAAEAVAAAHHGMQQQQTVATTAELQQQARRQQRIRSEGEREYVF